MAHTLTTPDKAADEPAASPVHPEEQPGWAARPLVAALLRVAIFVAPILASLLASFLVARAWHRPEGALASIGWLGVLIFIGGVAMITVDRVARRFLPLTALLRMTLIFPDQAPSRFNVAIRTGTTKQLERRLEHVQQFGLGDTEAEAAETLLHLAAALREHDRFTRGHGERVRAYTALIGEELGLDPVAISKLQWAGLVHDIGKLAIPEEVLNKPGRLTGEEYDLIKTHPAEGMAMMGSLTGWLGEWALAVGEHHERWDGAGYPAGLSGDDISLAGRIVAVADTFDVITATRSYKPAQSPQWARAELANNAGTQFDPDVVRAFLNISLGRLRGVMWPLSWIAHIPLLGSTVTAPASGLAAATVAVVGSSITGGNLAGAVPDDVDGGPAAVAVEVDVASPITTTTVVVVEAAAVPSTTSMPIDAGRTEAAVVNDGDGPDRGPVDAPTTTLRRADEETDGTVPPVVPVIVTVPPMTRRTTITTVPTTPVTTIAGPSTATTPTTPATVPAAAPTTTAVPTTAAAPTTTAVPTTTAAANACERARAGETALAGADLRGCDLSGLTLTNVDLSGANLAGANLDGATLSNFDLDGAVLSGADLRGAVLRDGTMRGVSAADIDATGIRVERVDATGATLTDAEFVDARLIDVVLASIDARGIEFERARLTTVTLADARISEASFQAAVLTDVKMQRAIARYATFEDADARGTDFSSTNLRESDLSTADLSAARLEGTNIGLAQLQETNLRGGTGRPVGSSSAEYDDTICPDGSVRSSTCWP